MLDRIANKDGFLAALDQSGGSTPKALDIYGCPRDQYVEGQESMFEAMHAMRCRIMTSPSFHGDHGILGAILFEDTMDRSVPPIIDNGEDSDSGEVLQEQPQQQQQSLLAAQYLWRNKKVVPFLKIDKGLLPEQNGVQLLQYIPRLPELLVRARQEGVFGTKMRSVIHSANDQGIQELVAQQFALGRQILKAGLIPIIEPEVNIHSPDKQQCEVLLRAHLLKQLDELASLERNDKSSGNNNNSYKVMLKLTLPSVDHFYQACIDHPNALRVVALSGGYSRDEATARLSQQSKMIASFSRALTEGLSYSMTNEEFDSVLQDAIHVILKASKA
jgi:fructose-bisphosphate aldolase, class I